MNSTSSLLHTNIDRLLKPRSIAFVGGGGAADAIRLVKSKGYGGRIFSVHPKLDSIEDIACVPSVSALPEAPDAAFVAVSGRAAVDVVRELAAIGACGALCYAAGFAESGEAGRALQDELVAAAGNMALVGPNCFGLVNFVNHGSLWPRPFPENDGGTGVAAVVQSGNLAINLVNSQRSVPWSYVVSIGNQAVLGVEHFVNHFALDPDIKAIGVYLEGLRDVPAFHQAALLAADNNKPVVVLKSGSSQLGAQLAMSHTSSLAGSDEFYNALFERTGIIRVRTVPEMEETLKLLSTSGGPRGRRVTVMSASGGDAGMAADMASEAGLEFVQPDAVHVKAVEAELPDYAHVSNPLDFTAVMWGQEEPLTRVFTEMMSSPCDQAVLIVDSSCYDLDTDGHVHAMVSALAMASHATGVPAARVSINPESMSRRQRAAALQAGVVPLQGLDEAMRAIASAARYREWQSARADAQTPLPLLDVGGEQAKGSILLDEHTSKAGLARYGLAVPAGGAVGFEQLADAAEEVGFPVVIKALTAKLPHKTEAGAVVLGVANKGEARAAGEKIRASVANYDPAIAVDMFLVEKMADKPVAELIVGIKRDPSFGLALVIGLGGIFVELTRQAEVILLPTTRERIEAALTTGVLGELLRGFRGRSAGDVDAAAAAIMAIAKFAEANSDRIVELDVNPLMIMPAGRGVVAVDALVRASGELR